MTFTLPSNISLDRGPQAGAAARRAHRSAARRSTAMLSQLGRPEDGTDAKLTNNLEFFVKLKPPDAVAAGDADARRRDRRDAAARSTRSPGVEVNFSQPIRDNVNENISGQSGPDRGQALRRRPGRAAGAGREGEGRASPSVPGVADLAHREERRGRRRSGSSPTAWRWPATAWTLGDFQHVFQTALGGRPVADFWEGERALRRGDAPARSATRDDVEKIRQAARAGRRAASTVPLEALAHVDAGLRPRVDQPRERPALHRHPHERARPRPGRLRRRGARARSTQRRRCPPGMTIEWGGEFENKERAMERLDAGRAGGAAASRCSALQGLRLASRCAVLTLLNVPFALIGGVFGLCARRHAAVGRGGGRLHRAHRPGVAERRAGDCRRSPSAAGAASRSTTRSSTGAASGCGRC